MPLTGRIGTADSQPGNIQPGIAGGGGPTTQTVQARANIYGKSSQSVQAKANIYGKSNRTVQVRARIGFATTQQTVQARANILITVYGSCEVDFNVFPTIEQRCIVNFNVSDKVVSYRTVQAKARILQEATATLSVTYTVNYPMPTGILRPTERTTFS